MIGAFARRSECVPYRTLGRSRSHWDPYPFILLNLALSFQAAYAAPFIMMSQNRQQDIDRREAENDYRINIKAELEIELLHDKIEQLHSKFDQLRDKEILALVEAVKLLSDIHAPTTQADPELAVVSTDVGR